MFGATQKFVFVETKNCVWFEPKQANCRFTLCHHAQVSLGSHRHHMYHQPFHQSSAEALDLLPDWNKEREQVPFIDL